MKKRGLFSLLSLATLLVACVLFVLFTGANAAEGPTVIYTRGDLGVEGAVQVAGITAAFEDMEQREWGPADTVEFRFAGEISGGAQDGVLFRQQTIFRKDGSKLPITIRGVDTNVAGDAFIYLDGVGGWYACANDYTFINLTLPIGSAPESNPLKFYAGSGNIRFENVNFAKVDGASVPDVEAQTKLASFLKRAAEYYITDPEDVIEPDINIFPISEAWQLLRESDDPEIAHIGQGLNATAAAGYYGDYLHDGDVGGGQYLNACIIYEVLTHTSSIGNTWRPSYALSEDMVALMQETAHQAVLARYGADYFNTPRTDIVGNDGWINALFVGSSNGSYYPDELVEIAYAGGVNMRVIHAYESGNAFSENWSWWQNPSASAYTPSMWTHEGGKVGLTQKAVKDLLPLYKWDAITTWQCSSKFDNYTKYDEAAWQSTWNGIYPYGSKIYNTYYNADNGAYQDAEWYWYEASAFPVNVTSISQNITGYVFADTCTDAVFAGWDLEPGEVVETSITFGEGCFFQDKTNVRISAVGYGEAPATPYTETTAKEVKYPSVLGVQNVPDVRPYQIKSSIIVDGDSTYLGKVAVKKGFAPSLGDVQVKKGSVAALLGVAGTSESSVKYYGDVSLSATSGTFGTVAAVLNADLVGDVTMVLDSVSTGAVCAIQNGVITGNVSITVKNSTLGGVFAPAYGSSVSDGSKNNSKIDGNVSVSFDTVTAASEVAVGCYSLGDSITGNVTADVKGLTVSNRFELLRFGTIGGTADITVHSGSYAGGAFATSQLSSAKTVTGKKATLTIKGGTFDGVVQGVGGTSNFATEVIIEDGIFNNYVCGGSDRNTTGNAALTIKGGTFNSLVMGGNSAGNLTGNVTTTITGGTFHKTVYGGSAAGTLTGNITNTIKAGSFVMPDPNPGANSKWEAFVGGNLAGTVNGTITNHVDGGNFSGTFVGGMKKGNVTGKVHNIIGKNYVAGTDLIVHGDDYGVYYGGGADETPVLEGGVVNEIYAGNFVGRVTHRSAMGGYNSTVNADTEGYAIKNYLYGGTFGEYYGALRGSGGAVNGTVYNYFDGVTVNSTTCGGGFYLTPAASIENVFVSGTYYGGNFICGSNSVPSGGSMTDLTNTFRGNPTIHGTLNLGAGNTPIGTLTINLEGGTVPSAVYGNLADLKAATIIVNVSPKAGDLTVTGTLQSTAEKVTVNLLGGDHKILLGKAASIVADAFDGKALTVSQTEEWTPNAVYVKVLEGGVSGITFEKAEGVKGAIEKEEGATETIWFGKAPALYGASLILEDRISLRLWFEKDLMDVIDNFAFNVSMGGEFIAENVTASEMEVLTSGGVTYYTLLLPGTAAQNFSDDIEISGLGLETDVISIHSLAQRVIDNENAFGAEFATLAKAIQNYGIEAYNRFSGETSAHTKNELNAPAAVEVITRGENIENAPFSFVGSTLVLKEAVGLKLYGLVADGYTVDDIQVRLNGKVLTAGEYTIAASTVAGTNVSIAIYPHAAMMSTALEIEVLVEGELCATFTESIASAAQSYVTAGGNDAAVCYELLRYVEAVNAYFN